MQGVFAELYRRNLSLETSKGLTEKARSGLWVGTVPFGYAKDKAGRLVPTAAAEAVRVAFAFYRAGEHSDITIADELNKRGYRSFARDGSQRLFGRKSIRALLKNHAYRGYVSSGGQVYKGLHEPMVSEEDWNTVQAIREARTSRGGRAGVRGEGLLTRLARCARCGKRMWLHHSGRYRYYICSGRDHRTCTAPLVNIDGVDARVRALVRQFSVPVDRQQLIIERGTSTLAPGHHSVRDLSVDRQAILERMERIKLLYEDGDIDRASYRRKRDELLTHLREHAQPEHNRDLHAALAYRTRSGQLFDTLERNEQRAVLLNVLTAFWLDHRRVSAATPTELYWPLISGIWNHQCCAVEESGAEQSFSFVSGSAEPLVISIGNVSPGHATAMLHPALHLPRP